jgi:ribosomal-protein-alanine N-acetyltransferase
VFGTVLAAPEGATSLETCQVLAEPVAAAPQEFAELVDAEAAGGPVTIVGPGVDRFGDVFRRALPSARLMEAPLPLAEAAARLAEQWAHRAVQPHALRPIYLRRPDAVLVRERLQRERALADGLTVTRLGVGDDLAAVEQLQRQTFVNPWGADAIRWELEHTDVARLYVLREADGGLSAYCACWIVFDELHINSLAVDVGRRRQGLARRLLREVLREAVDEGARSATLEVRASNVAARRLYEQLGFKAEGVRRDYYQDPREDAIILWTRQLRRTAAALESGAGQ